MVVIDKYMMWMSRIDGIGITKLNRLLDIFGSAEAVYSATRHDLKSVGFLNEQNIKGISSIQNDAELTEYISELKEKGIRFISRFDDEYPSLLKQIYSPPLGLYIYGEMPDERLPKVSIIGSRKCTEYGLAVANKLSLDLAACGVVIVSGMARGIDSMAHRGAIQAEGFTVAVLGCGVDVCYPPENRVLREDIIRYGSVISEYPPGTSPFPGNFPARNRIISGLSIAIVVVEAAKQSGTLITTEYALEQGREVMAVPGCITSKFSCGTNDLIKDGAVPVTGYQDVLDYLKIEYLENEPENNMTYKSSKTNNNISDSLAPFEKVVYDCIGFEAVTADEIIRAVKSDSGTVNYILTMLELSGYIRKLPGQRYMRF